VANNLSLDGVKISL